LSQIGDFLPRILETIIQKVISAKEFLSQVFAIIAPRILIEAWGTRKKPKSGDNNCKTASKEIAQKRGRETC
jgi:hypothetical protein